jgi:ATP-dependent Lon protease
MPKRKESDTTLQYRQLTYGEYTSKDDLEYLNKKTKTEQTKLLNELTLLHNTTSSMVPLMFRLLESPIPIHFKMIAYKKILALDKEPTGKLQQWVESFLRIPFQKGIPLSVQFNQTDKCQSFLKECEVILDKCTYGMKQAKAQFLQLIGKWIVNPDSMGTAIALKGPMGTGKTTLIKHGISKLLNRAFAFITLGGASDGTFLEGHSYTYEGSTYGKIVDILIQTKSNNPILFFDELDKVSQSEKGNEIIGILTHLIDTTQNTQFHDKYFSEIDFDLSKCLFVFSYNDETLVNPILKDRMVTIEIPGYDGNEKRMIALDYLIPEIEKEYRMQNVLWTDDCIDYLIEKTKEESGVRNLKRSLDTVYSKLNLQRIQDPNFLFPYQIDTNKLDEWFPESVQETSYSSMYL